MKILYDTQVMMDQRRGGVSRYHYELARGMVQSGQEVRLEGRFIKNQYFLSGTEFADRFHRDDMGLFAAINKYQLRYSLRKADYDVFHATIAREYILSAIPKEAKVVFTIHDMIHEKRKGFISPVKKAMAERADLIIAISQTTRADVVRMLNIPPEKISVIYHASSLSATALQPTSVVPPQQYVLYVGERADYKNFNTFVRAAADVMRRYEQLHLVCVGRAFSETEKVLLSELRIAERTVLYSNISDNQLTYLYDRAKVFVFPSLDEGFGIPILEAWACNTPIALSDTACFREVAADGGVFFNPENADDITNAICNILNDEGLRQRLTGYGLERLKQFSWANTCRQTLNAYSAAILS